jgi:hypothetical protein
MVRPTSSVWQYFEAKENYLRELQNVILKLCVYTVLKSITTKEE